MPETLQLQAVVVDPLPEQAALAPVLPLGGAPWVAAQLVVHQLVELLA